MVEKIETIVCSGFSYVLLSSLFPNLFLFALDAVFQFHFGFSYSTKSPPVQVEAGIFVPSRCFMLFSNFLLGFHIQHKHLLSR